MAVSELEAPERAPLHERRPGWVTFTIDTNFEKMRAFDRGQPYGSNGDRTDIAFVTNGFRGVLRSAQLVGDTHERLGRALKILEIGAGAGQFILGCLEQGHDAQGLSAHDYRKLPEFDHITKHLPESAYVVGDAHYLHRLGALATDYDLIVSNLAFMHMVDPLSVLELAADRLNSDGTMAINDVEIRRPYTKAANAETVVGAFWAAGFDVSQTSFKPAEMVVRTLVAERQGTTEPVRIPVDYRSSGFA